MSEKYYSLEELIDIIDEPNRSCCKKIYSDNKIKFEKSKGASMNHQIWEGWYLDHIKDTLNIAFRLYNDLTKCRKLQFSLSDAILILYLHDLEKPWKYAWTEEEKEELKSFIEHKDFVKNKIKQYWFQLNDAHWNALKYAHWEGNDYNINKRVQWPLGAFIHCCDSISARIWFDYPKKSDNW